MRDYFIKFHCKQFIVIVVETKLQSILQLNKEIEQNTLLHVIRKVADTLYSLHIASLTN